MPTRRSNGSSSSLAAAIARHSVGAPYSALAIEASESPSTTRWARVLRSAPDVGFCFGGFGSYSCIEILHVARTGWPDGRNSVKVALTDLTTPTNGFAAPHENTTIGGNGVFELIDLSVGRTADSSVATDVGHVAVVSVGGVEEHLDVERPRLGAGELRLLAASFFCGLKFQPACSDML